MHAVIACRFTLLVVRYHVIYENKQTNKHINKNNVVIEANRQTSYSLSIAALLAAVANITVDYGTVHVIFIQKKGFNARRESLYTVG